MADSCYTSRDAHNGCLSLYRGTVFNTPTKEQKAQAAKNLKAERAERAQALAMEVQRSQRSDRFRPRLSTEDDDSTYYTTSAQCEQDEQDEEAPQVEHFLAQLNEDHSAQSRASST